MKTKLLLAAAVAALSLGAAGAHAAPASIANTDVAVSTDAAVEQAGFKFYFGYYGYPYYNYYYYKPYPYYYGPKCYWSYGYKYCY